MQRRRSTNDEALIHADALPPPMPAIDLSPVRDEEETQRRALNGGSGGDGVSRLQNSIDRTARSWQANEEETTPPDQCLLYVESMLALARARYDNEEAVYGPADAMQREGTAAAVLVTGEAEGAREDALEKMRRTWCAWFPPHHGTCTEQQTVAAEQSAESADAGDMDDSLPDSLARLLCQYIPPEARTSPLSPSSRTSRGTSLLSKESEAHHNSRNSGSGSGRRAAPSLSGVPPVDVAEQTRWIQLLPARWLPQALKATRPSPTPSPVPRPPPSPQQQQQKEEPSQQQHDPFYRTAQRPPSSSLSHADPIRSGVNEDGEMYTSQQLKSEQLMFSLLHYPHEASVCLSMSRGLTTILAAMQAAPPPPLPVTNAPADSAAPRNSSSSSTRRKSSQGRVADQNRINNRDIGERRGGGVRAPHNRKQKLEEVARNAYALTCPCGCLVQGCLVDRFLYGYHCHYYQKYGAKNLLQRQGGRGEDGAPKPHQQQQNQQQQQQLSSFVLSQRQNNDVLLRNSSRASYRNALSMEVLPLLALQLFAIFVWRGSEKQMHLQSLRSRPKARRQRRESSPHATAASTVVSRLVNTTLLRNNAAAVNQRKADTTTPRPHAPSPASNVPSRASEKEPSDETNAFAFRTAFCDFCSEEHRMRAVAACVVLAWADLSEDSSYLPFAPHLDVMALRHASPRRPSSNLSATPASALAQAAACFDACTPHQLGDWMLKSILEAHAARDGVVPSAVVRAFLQMRMGELAQPPASHSSKPTTTSTTTTTTTTSVFPQNLSENAADGTPQEAPPVQMRENVRELVEMESFIVTAVNGQHGQMPLWCQVAVEVAQLYVESRQRAHALWRASTDTLARETQKTDDKRAGDSGVATACELEGIWERLQCRRMRQLVLLMLRLLLLPTMEAAPIAAEEQRRRKSRSNATTTSTSTTTTTTVPTAVARRGEASPRQSVKALQTSPLCVRGDDAIRNARMQRVVRNVTKNKTVVAAREREKENEAVVRSPSPMASGMQAPVPSPDASTLAEVAAASSSSAADPSADVIAFAHRMAHHPYFGVAVAVVSEAVTLSWAVTLLSGRSVNTSTQGGCASTAALAAATENSAAASLSGVREKELLQLVTDIQKWLRNAEELTQL